MALPRVKAGKKRILKSNIVYFSPVFITKKKTKKKSHYLLSKHMNLIPFPVKLRFSVFMKISAISTHCIYNGGLDFQLFFKDNLEI